MRTVLKVFLYLVAAMFATYMGAVLYGVYLGVTNYDSTTDVALESPSPEHTDTNNENQAATTSADEQPISQISAEASLRWLMANGYLGVQGDNITYDSQLFSSLRLDYAIEIYRNLSASAERDQFEPIRLLFFALCGNLPADQRRTFADAAGAVFPGEIERTRSRGYRGDYLALMYVYTDKPLRSAYAAGLQQFAEVLSDKEMVQVLKSYGAFTENVGDDGGWNIRVHEKMQDFDADTVMAFHDAVDDALLGHRRYLRSELAELAIEKRE